MAGSTNVTAVRHQFDAWNAGDWNRLSRDVADGYLMDSDTNQSPIVGKDGLRQYARALNASFPDLRYELLDVFAEGDLVATTWIAAGTQRGEFRGIPATGRRIELHGCTVTRFRAGRIARQHVFWDSQTLYRQLGAARAAPRSAATVDRPLTVGEATRE